MSVGVNLIPREVEERNRERRERVLLGIGVLVLVGVLALAYIWKLGQVGDAEAELEEVEAQVAELEAELATLQEFEELGQRLQLAEDLLEVAFGREASMAGLLQDVAAVMPTDSELSELNVALVGPEDVEPEIGALRIPEGQLTAVGRSVGGVAPGIERVLLEFGKIAAFDNVFLGQATRNEEGQLEFTVEVDLGPEVRTGRYLDGLPEELE